MIGGGVELIGTSGSPVVRLKHSYVNMSNFHVRNGDHGIVADGCPIINLSNGTVRNVNLAGIKTRYLGNQPHVISDINLSGVSGSGENPLYLMNTDNISISGISAKPARSTPVVRVGDCANISIEHITPVGSNGTVQDDGNNTFRSNRGNVTLSGSSTAVTVSHKLAETPAPESVTVTPNGSLSNASSWHISNLTSTTFDIATDTEPGQDVPFGWSANL